MRNRSLPSLRSLRPTLPLLALTLAGALLPFSATSQAATAKGTTTFVLVRHAEKATDHPTDPTLSSAGAERARDLARVLDGAGLSAVYVTEYKRTSLTAEPTAQHFDLTPVSRPRAQMTPEAYAADLAPKLVKKHAGQAVLIVGHSDTVPALVKALTGQTVPPIAETEFDRLYLVEVPKTGAARVIAARYGKPAP